MSTAAFHVVRVGTGITFLWISVLIFREPELWGSLLQPWAAGILPFPLREAMIGTAILDAAIGLALLVDRFTLISALVGLFHILTVITVVGIDVITVRDIGLGAAALALAIDSWPKKSLPPGT